jgi:membrane-associated protease RseP (regulator of RpoE activity)
MGELQKLILTALVSSLLTALGFMATDFAPTIKIANCAAPPTLANSPPHSFTEAQDLAAQLAAEQEARQALQYEIEWLQGMLEKSVASSSAKPPDNIPQLHNAGLWFDDNALLTLGIDATEVTTIREHFNQAELDKLNLYNQANRQGGLSGKPLMDKLQEIQQNLQHQLSEENYDRMLYASGQMNRASITDILSASPAANAGLQIGDQIIRYDGKRIYSPADLYQATTEGEAGELIAVDIERNNENIILYMPRGPMGTRLLPKRSKPE